jgi:LPXTG-motif cell wall-anchored protein
MSSTAQAIPGLAAADVGGAEARAMLAALGAHVEEFVVVNGADDPGYLSYLILAATALGDDPTSFGTGNTNLVARLQATKTASGLFGSADPSFDGAFRQGLSLMALDAVGLSDAAAADWLANQQCASGIWVPFRADTSVPCPPIDFNTFTGPDTNSTALALLGLDAAGVTGPLPAGVAALDNARNSEGGWGFFAASDQPTDANSTGLVVEALLAVTGTRDAQGTAALLALQSGCDADPLDRGGIAYQPGPDGVLVPNVSATVQSMPALAGVPRPIVDDAPADGLPDPCAPPVPATTSTTVAGANAATTATAPGAPSTTVASDPLAVAELPRTGSSDSGLALVGALATASGALVVLAARRRWDTSAP